MLIPAVSLRNVDYFPDTTGMCAFPKSGRSDQGNSGEIRVCFRPGAVIRSVKSSAAENYPQCLLLPKKAIVDK